MEGNLASVCGEACERSRLSLMAAACCQHTLSVHQEQMDKDAGAQKEMQCGAEPRHLISTHCFRLRLTELTAVKVLMLI